MTGGELWRSVDGVSWEKVADNGFGDEANHVIQPQIVFKDYLYAVTFNLNGLNIYRSGDGLGWERVVADGFNYGVNRNFYGILVEFDGALFLHTMSTPMVGAFQIWRSYDGESWMQIGDSGFGNENNYFSGMFKASDGLFYLATLNMLDGTEVWRSEDAEEWKMIFKDDGANRPMGDLRELNGYLYLMLTDYDEGIKIWRYRTPIGAVATTTTTPGPTYTQTPTTTVTTTPTVTATATITTQTTTPTTTTPAPQSRWGLMEYGLIGAVAAVAAVLLYAILRMRSTPPPPPPPPPP